MSASPDTRALMFGAGAALVVGLLLYLAAQKAVKVGTQAAEKAIALVNPLSTENVAYGAVNATGAALSGNRDFSLGALIYDLTHAEIDMTTPRTSGGGGRGW